MNAELLELVTDTIEFLQKDLPAKPPQVVKKTPTPKPIKKEPEIAPPPLPQPKPAAASPKSLIDKIEKHLPHLKLIETIPSPRKAAIVYANEEDLPFLSNLKNAIEKYHCPVKMIQDDTENLDPFALVISQKQVSAKEKILLEPIATYQNNTQQKKLLWSTICNILSPKSS